MARLSYVESFGLPLGAMHVASYTQQTVALRPGDRLLLVSDGVVEAMNGAHELWGFERLEAAFRSAGGERPGRADRGHPGADPRLHRRRAAAR